MLPTTLKMACNALQTKQYDLLLLDIMMGRGAEGIMIARKLRKDVKLRELPVLIITGMREQIAFLFPGEPVHPRFVEIDELVEKPVEPKLLLEKVNGSDPGCRSQKSWQVNNRTMLAGPEITSRIRQL